METRTKVLFLITKSNWGGAQRYVYDLATNLPPEQFTSVVVLGGDGPLAQKLREAKICVHSISALQRDISFSKELRSLREIYTLIRQEQPDVLHINSSKAGILGAILGRLAGVKRIVFTAHAWAFNEDRGSFARLCIKFLHWLTVLLSHQTIAVSKAIKDQMKWPGAQRKLCVIHNGRAPVVYLSKLDARRELSHHNFALAKHQADIWTGTIAELHPVKRHDIMIKAIAALVATGHNLRHIIIGDGEERETLTQLIAELNLTNHVFVLGHIDEAARFLKGFDIFVLPSRSEALAYTVIEAAQAGLPIVASRTGGIPEVVTHEVSGLLVEPENVAALQTALTTLLENPATRAHYGTTATTARETFSLTKMLTHTIACYQSHSLPN